MIESKLADIATFAELERHFDTPLKRYSVGMQSRLCFAIAMLFPANVYCFDEVLAVVDGEFKDRCLAEVRALAARGATVFFISHDLDQVGTLCNRVMWLQDGAPREIGDAESVIDHYARHVTALTDTHRAFDAARLVACPRFAEAAAIYRRSYSDVGRLAIRLVRCDA